MNKNEIVVIGAGPAGLTAAIYLERAGYHAIVLESAAYGGQMANTPEVENYPGTGKIGGFELSQKWYEQAVEQGAQVEFDEVAEVSLAGEEKRITTVSGKEYRTRAVIIANGVKRRMLGIPGEETFAGRGVSYCATCDGGFFRKKTAVVVGGGNTAVEDALYLSNLCERVHLLHRRDSFRAVRALTDALEARANITLHLNTIPVQILPNEAGKAVGALEVQELLTNTLVQIPTDAVFVAIGLAPENGMFAKELSLDSAGYIIANEDTKTNLPGVFVAGDTRTKTLRQILTAAGDGAQAATEVGHYLTQL